MSHPPRSRHQRSLAALIATIALTVTACAGSSTGSAPPPKVQTITSTTLDRGDAKPTTTTVFRAGDDGYASYRIPAVIAAQNGDLLAFAEGRVTGAADDGNVDLVLKRSTDEGKTWGALQVIAEDASNFVGNPAPVVDPKTGRVVVLATHKDGDDTEIEILTGNGDDSSRVWLLSSTDDGRTWGRPDDITSTVKADTWRWYTVGPGHAIALRHGPHKGRLVAAANHTDAEKGAGDHVLYSDDGGRTWQQGADDTPGGSDHPDENTVAELADGTLVFISRNQNEGATWHRLRATSTDGGETFATPYAPIEDLAVPVVQGSTLFVERADAPGRGTLYFSAPADQSERKDLTIRASQNGGKTWSVGTKVVSGPSSYSDLIELPGNRIGDLYEVGTANPTERIDFTVQGLQLVG